VAISASGRLAYRSAQRHQQPASGPVVLALVGAALPLVSFAVLVGLGPGLDNRLAGLLSVLAGLAAFAAAGQLARSSPLGFAAFGLGLYAAAAVLSVIEIVIVIWLFSLIPVEAAIAAWLLLATGSGLCVFALTARRGDRVPAMGWPSSPPEPDSDDPAAAPPARWTQLGGGPPAGGGRPPAPPSPEPEPEPPPSRPS
jgi:hypothetical protein